MATILDPLKIYGAWAGNFNVTLYIASLKDLTASNSRVLKKLGNFFYTNTVENLRNTVSGQPNNLGAILKDSATTLKLASTTANSVPEKGARNAISAGSRIFIDAKEKAIIDSPSITMQVSRIAGNIFSYATSKWALGCIIAAIVLNRTNVYARTRWNLQLSWKIRFLFRLMPVFLILSHCQRLLLSINCQTSPDFAMLGQQNRSKHADLTFTQNGRILHGLSSKILLGISDRESCLRVGMISVESDVGVMKTSGDDKMTDGDLTGSLSYLWSLFKTLGFSQFVEEIFCVVEGRQKASEYGMSLFEHSLAFAEAEAIVVKRLELGSLETSKTYSPWKSYMSFKAPSIPATRASVLKMANATPEVLLVGLISAMNHLTSHILAIFNLQASYRLLNTGIWGLAYMAVTIASILSFSMADEAGKNLMRFPTVCLISFIPHVLILFCIIVCSLIYIIALLLTALAPPIIEHQDESYPSSNRPFIQRLFSAHRNMQANVTYSNLNLTLRRDFYTALLRAGLAIMTMASEAVYLNESKEIVVKQRTWLEEDRLQEFEAVGVPWLGPSSRLRRLGSNTADGFSEDIGLVAAKGRPTDQLQDLSSGYAREMTAQTPGTTGRSLNRSGGHGVGALERSERWYMALEFCCGISRLILSCTASFLLRIAAKVGIQSQPRWLLAMILVPSRDFKDVRVANRLGTDPLNPNVLNLDGKFEIHRDEKVDIEAELRRKSRQGRKRWTDADELELDASLYRWWLSNGWWGDSDNSGNFLPTEQEPDEDTTSVISFSSTADDQTWDSDNTEVNGHRTPTQRSPLVSRESTPINDTTLTLPNLAQLLNPKTPDQRTEAEILAIHLSDEHVVTRSRYQRIQQHSRAKVLTSTLQRPSNFVTTSPDGNLTLEEEARLLEHLIITRRNVAASTQRQRQNPSILTGDASYSGESGPLCVVCQCSPRCIIVWPCRCLSLCNDCRVTLAMNNFDKCVCCRRDVKSYSRIFMP